MTWPVLPGGASTDLEARLSANICWYFLVGVPVWEPVYRLIIRYIVRIVVSGEERVVRHRIRTDAVKQIHERAIGQERDLQHQQREQSKVCDMMKKLKKI